MSNIYSQKDNLQVPEIFSDEIIKVYMTVLKMIHEIIPEILLLLFVF